MSSWMEGITPEEIPEQYRKLAKTVGMQPLIALSATYGGDNMYVPKLETLIRNKRDALIKDEYNGYNIEYLAKKYDLTVRWVQEIVREQIPGQLSLWEITG